MKRLVLMLSIAAAAAFVFAACNKGEKTDLAWTNKNSSGGAAINDIIWADGDATWTNGTTGYADGVTTEPKAVGELTGAVTCSIQNGQDFQPATVIINGTQNPTLSLKEGESYVYEISANTK